jgi:hypothetical protein
MKNRGTINLLIDLLMLPLMAALGGIGFLMKYVLPSGRDKILRGGSNRDMLLWGMDRHQWGDLHLILAYILLGLLVLHIVFHWGCILSMVRQRLPSARWRQGAWVTVSLVTLFLLLFPFMFSPVEAGNDAFLHRNIRVSEDPQEPVSSGLGEEAPILSSESPSMPTPQAEHDHSGEINGRMTLREAAVRLGLTLDEARKRLDLQNDVDETVSLGRIRHRLGINMEDLRHRLETPVSGSEE